MRAASAENPSSQGSLPLTCRLQTYNPSDKPPKKPRRGPNCGAPTPTPVPLRISYSLSNSVDDVEACGQRAGARHVKHMRHAEIDLRVVRQVGAVRNRPLAVRRSTRSARSPEPREDRR